MTVKLAKHLHFVNHHFNQFWCQIVKIWSFLPTASWATDPTNQCFSHSFNWNRFQNHRKARLNFSRHANSDTRWHPNLTPAQDFTINSLHFLMSRRSSIQALKHGPIKIPHLKFNHKPAHKPTFSLTMFQVRAKRSAFITTQSGESSLLLNHVMSYHGTINWKFLTQDLQNKLTENVMVKTKLLHKLLLNLALSSKSTVNWFSS
jgi:hypothetical protein